MDISGLSGYYSDIYANASSNQAAESVKSSLSSVNSSTSDEELMDACKQFESYFVEQMFKEMWKTIPESEYSSGSTNSMVSFYKDEMIKTIAEDSTEQNGLGLAQMLYEQMKRNYGL
ncbi:MAG: rod-binding protein [Lachnospiraceae bacterium]|nr:rod-binding protein [Lachnospiraceae bacterium]